jgi:threonine/homoserine/homoserine lactone efflux protein
MPAWSSILLFGMIASMLVVTPGPAVLYIITCSLAHGRRAGVISAVGTATGNLLHAVATTLGISALLASSALAFGVVQYVGAAFLIYHGLRTIGAAVLLYQSRHPFGASVAGQECPVLASRPLSRLFVQGVLVNLLNPVTMLFFCAVLPQFVDPASGTVGGQILFFGCLYVVLGLGNGSLYALLAGTLSGWLQEHIWCLRTLHGLIGSMYVALGLSTALAGIDKV